MTADALQERLTALILANPAVVTVYSVRPLAVELASRTVAAVTDGQVRLPKVLVSESKTGTDVSVSVGVSGERSAAGVCRDLHDSIALELATADVTLPLSIAVKIASVS
jgi:hypothetical protein